MEKKMKKKDSFRSTFVKLTISFLFFAVKSFDKFATIARKSERISTYILSNQNIPN